MSSSYLPPTYVPGEPFRLQQPVSSIQLMEHGASRIPNTGY